MIQPHNDILAGNQTSNGIQSWKQYIESCTIISEIKFLKFKNLRLNYMKIIIKTHNEYDIISLFDNNNKIVTQIIKHKNNADLSSHLEISDLAEDIISFISKTH